MELPKIPGNMLGGIKSRLGLSNERADDVDDYDAGYDEYGEYGEYEDYGEYGYEPEDSGYAAPASSYSAFTPVTTRSAGSARADRGYPRLVSLDDVKASTRVPDRLGRDPLPPRRSSVAPVMVENSGPAPSSPAAKARERSESLNSIFASTTSVPEAPAASAPAGKGYDPYDAYTGGVASGSHTPNRQCAIIKPSTYSDAEQVAKTLRAGDVAVVCLGGVADQLAKRILDFSFGAATALDASVECVASKVFVLCSGPGLSDLEKARLRSKGIL